MESMFKFYPKCGEIVLDGMLQICVYTSSAFDIVNIQIKLLSDEGRVLAVTDYIPVSYGNGITLHGIPVSIPIKLA